MKASVILLPSAIATVVIGTLLWRANGQSAPPQPVTPIMGNRESTTASNTIPVATPARTSSTEENAHQQTQSEAEKAALIQARLLEASAKTGLTTNELWRQWESYYYPDRVRQRNETRKNAYREGDLAAGGEYAQMWKRQAELEVLSDLLSKGMHLSEVTNILGTQFYAEARIVTNRVSRPYHVPREQLDRQHASLTLTFSPHPMRRFQETIADDLRDWQSLVISLDGKLQVTSWTWFAGYGLW